MYTILAYIRVVCHGGIFASLQKLLKINKLTVCAFVFSFLIYIWLPSLHIMMFDGLHLKTL